jgi:serine/threonine protein phosphatase PrpC
MSQTCRKCGALAEAESRFCESCGARLNVDAASAEPADAPGDRVALNLTRELASISDRGRVHVRNEDAVALLMEAACAVLVVCDGVSTSHDPALGSRTAADAAAQYLQRGAATCTDPAELMRGAILAGHAAICDIVPADTGSDARPLTTIVAAFVKAGVATIGWAGDSRAYRLTGNAGRLLTHDDSWVNWAVAQGDMTESEAMHSPHAHAITQCLGVPDDPPEPHVVAAQLSPGDMLLLCSDGLWNYAPTPAALAALISDRATTAPAVDLCEILVRYANEAGGRDNITAAIMMGDAGREAQ